MQGTLSSSKLLYVCHLILWLCISSTSHAVLTGGSVSPASTTMNAPTVVSLSWTVNTSDAPGAGTDVLSNPGEFIHAGNMSVIDTGGGLINFSGFVPASQQFVFSENIAIPASVTGSGASQVIFRRNFFDGTTTTIDFIINLSAGAGAQLQGVSVVPTAGTALQGQNFSLPLNWNLNVSPGTAINISSPNALLGGVAHGGDLSQSNVTGSLMVPETLNISATEIDTAISNGQSSLLYSRTFSQGGTTISGLVTVTLQQNQGMDSTLTAVTGSTSNSLIVGQNNIVPVAWRYQLNHAGSPVPVTVASSQGEVRTPDGGVLGNILTQLTEQSSSTFGIVNESITIPAGMVSEALSKGYNQLVFYRTFSDGENVVNAQTLITIVSPGGDGRLGSAHLELQFDDGSYDRSIDKNQKITAVAKLTSYGNGILEGQWEVASPPFSSSKMPQFFPLKQFSTVLSQGQEHRINSPELPANSPGMYIVRFNLRTPTVQTLPVIQYRVLGLKNASTIELITPINNSVVSKEQAFKWRVSPENVPSMLQVFKKITPENQSCSLDVSSKPLTGMTSSTSSGSTLLSPLVRNKLTVGDHYCWRIVLLSNDTSHSSELRSFVWSGGRNQLKVLMDTLRLQTLGTQKHEANIVMDKLKLTTKGTPAGETHILMNTLRLPTSQAQEDKANILMDTLKLPTSKTQEHKANITMDTLELTSEGISTGEVHQQNIE